MKQLTTTDKIICRFSPKFTLREKIKLLFGYKLHYICEVNLENKVKVNNTKDLYKIIK